jgi:FG-GAP-like repeat
MLNLKPLGTPEFDFNSDGRTDYLALVAGQDNVFVQTATGQFRTRSLAAPAPEAGWAVDGVGDFDGDGQNDDLFWRNRRSNKTAIDLADAGTVTQTRFLSAQKSSFSAQFADFNGDGTTDIFWQHTGEQASEVWFIQAGRIAESSPLPTIASGWSAEIADFNADGKADLFWRNAESGQLSVWLLNGTQILAQNKVALPGNSGDLRLFDFNGDGRTDIFDRQRFTGRSQVWLWAESGIGPQPTPIALPASSPDGSFAFGDFNGDRRSDILFQAPVADTASLFLGNADGSFTTQVITGLANQFIDRLQDFDGDGKTDIRTQNFLSQASEIRLLNGSEVLQTKLSGIAIEENPPVPPVIDVPRLNPIVPPRLTIETLVPAPLPLIVPTIAMTVDNWENLALSDVI